jgi:DNA-binding IclR family transcriptional regulator
MAGNSADVGRSVTSKVTAILMAFTDGAAYSLPEIARLACLPSSTARRLARELTARGLLERGEDGSYWAGAPLRMMGAHAAQARTITDLGPRVMEDLSTATRTDVRLGVLADLGVAFTEKPWGSGPVLSFPAGTTLPAHATALGKALLAFSGSRAVDRVIAHGLRAYTPYTLTTPERFRRALAVVRLTRIAVSRYELATGVSAIAAPVFSPAGQVVAALEVAVRDLRSDLPVMQPALTVAARSLSRELATGSRVTRRGTAPDARRDGLTSRPATPGPPDEMGDSGMGGRVA